MIDKEVFETIETFNNTLTEKNEKQFYYKDDNKTKFFHNKFGDYLIEKYFIILVNDRLHIYDSGVYVNDERLIKRMMVSEIPKIKKIQQSEVLEYIKNTTQNKTEEAPHLIPLKNGVYDIKTSEFYNHSPNYIFTAKFNVSYNSTAKSDIIDQSIRMIANEDDEVIEMFKQIFGYLLYKDNFIGKSLLFVGNGGNGKSLILKIMQSIVGDENTSSVPLQALNEQFNVSSLYHKLLNAGDDIPLKSIEDASNFKKLTTGEPVLASYKGQDVFSFKNYAKLVFSANGLPRWFENSNGVFDRLIIVPFNARIRGTDKEDVHLIEKVTSEEAKSYVLNLAIKGLRDILRSGKILIPNVVQKEMDNFKKQNNPIDAFLDDYNIEHKKVTDVYDDYREWSEFEGYRNPLIRKEFKKQIEAKGYTKIRERVNGYIHPQYVYIDAEKVST